MFKVESDVADAWVIGAKGDYDYVYGGTRKVTPDVSDDAIEEELFRLMRYESHLKNSLINTAVEDGALEHCNGKLPKGFVDSKIGGGRCLFRPKNKALDVVLSEPTHEQFEGAIRILFKEVGDLLNKVNGRIKLTPDFGKFSGVSDILGEFTPYVLGIRCEDGGCGGKASYTTTGIIAALEVLDIESYKTKPVTLIGSDGALGVDVTSYFLTNSYQHTKVCDIVYDDENIDFERIECSVKSLSAKWGEFTDLCLQRGGVIVATTVGNELENSNWSIIPENTLLMLAHNLALPHGEKGKILAHQIESQGVTLIPGQMLTLGGALTSRLEWFSRKNNIQEFNKIFALEVVKDVVTFLIGKINDVQEGTMYEKMASYANFEL